MTTLEWVGDEAAARVESPTAPIDAETASAASVEAGRAASLPAVGRTRQYSTFRVGTMFMGIDLARVQELLRHQEMTRVPLAPRAIEGLINLRGQIVTALDMRRILGLPALVSAEARSMNIVIRSEGGPVSLLVDEICDVLDVPLDAAMPLPENMSTEQRELLEGVYQLECGLLLIVNTERVLESSHS